MPVELHSLQEALRAIVRHKLRSGLTILSIVIGVLTIAGLLSLALGVRRSVTEEIESLGSTTIAVVPGRVRTESGGLNPIAGFGVSTLTERDYAAIRREVPGLRRSAMGLLVSGTVRADDRETPQTLIFAATPEMVPLLHLTRDRGRLLDDTDERGAARVVVLGSAPAARLFPDRDPLGQEIALRGERLAVVGVLREQETSFALFGPNFNDLVVLPLATGWELTGTRQVFRIMVAADDVEAVEPVRAQVAAILRRNHGGEEDFTVLTQQEILGIVGNVLQLLTRMIGALAAISLVVGGINIMNIMLVAVAERTREIGIRKAVGATRRDLFLHFLLEAVVVSLLGGVIGVLLAAGGGALLGRFTAVPIAISGSVIALALAFSVGVGVLFGIAPAIRAARKDPVEALRSS